jgi:hypothetical protein
LLLTQQLHDSIFSLRWDVRVIKLVEPRHVLLKCLCQASRVSGHVYISILPIVSTIFLSAFGCRIFVAMTLT